MQISAQLAKEGIQYKQSLAGTGASAGAAAGCNLDERYACDMYIINSDACTVTRICEQGLIVEQKNFHPQEDAIFAV